MSHDDITAILLPTARVDIFAADTGTKATAETLSKDWRFARVGMQVYPGGIDGAIGTYGQSTSPELILVETDDISDAFLQKLGALAGVCAGGTDAVVIGPKNDVHLYRSLVEMGVKDYLVRPVSETDMVKVIARTLVEKRGLLGSRLATVIGSKGGVGTTAMTQVLSWSVAERLKQKTMMMDAAGSVGTLGISYGLEPVSSLSEAVRLGATGSDDDMKRIYQAATENLSALICGGDPILSPSPDVEGLDALINRIMQKYPVLIVDLSGATHELQKHLMARSSHVVVVTTPFLSALRNTRTLLAEIKSLRSSLEEVSLIVNMQGFAGGEEVSARDIKTVLDVEPALRVAYAPKIFAASETAGEPVGKNRAAEDLLASLIPVAEKISGVSYKGDAGGARKENLVAQMIGKIKKK